MKRSILSMLNVGGLRPFGAIRMMAIAGLTSLACLANAQISVYIMQPEDEAGPLNFTWSENWGADLNDPANTVESQLVLADDGTEGDSLACGPLVNDTEMAGKIALLYRGVCEFGAKALNAQNAGAAGVMIVNNIPGPPVGMGAGAVGDQVTIPVVMISDADGAYLRDLMNMNEVTVRIGTLTGVFPFNLSLERTHLLLPRAAAIPAEIAMDDTDLNFAIGAWVFNQGNTIQNDVVLNAQIENNGSTVYDQTSDEQSLAPGDSVFILLPQFSQTSYDGTYTLTYTIQSGEEDAFPSNNTFTSTMHIGEVFSYAEVDPGTGIPVTDTHIGPAGDPTEWRSCIFFSHPNANRLAATGLYVSAWVPADSVFAGRLLVAQANQWFAAIESPTDRPADDNSDLSEEQYGDHTTTEEERGQPIYIPFLEPLVLENDENYLFCLVSNEPGTYHGYDSDLAYDQNMEEYLMPISNLQNATWFNGFTGFDTHPSIGVRMVDSSIGIEESDRIDITPFPNPTNDHIRIPLAGQSGAAYVEIFDMSGAKVAQHQVNIGGSEQLILDVRGMSNGTYMFNMNFENGKQATFRVVVNR